MTCVLPGGLGQLKASPGFSAFSTTNKVSTGVPPGWWSPSGTSPTFSNNNRTAISASGGAVISGLSYKNTGRLYFEITFAGASTTAADGAGIGGPSWVMNSGAGLGADAQLSVGLEIAAALWVVYFNNAISYNFPATPAAGDVVGVATDFVASAGNASVNFRLNANWLNRGTPTTTFPTSTFDAVFAASAPGCIIGANCDTSGTMTLNVGNAAFANAMPAGYSAWG